MAKKKVVVEGIVAKYGVNAIKLGASYVGKTVEEVASLLSSVLNLPEGAIATVNGKTVEDQSETTLKKGNTLEFVKPAGSKG